MEIYKLQQLWVLGICTVAGMLCGIVYDSFRAYRRCFPQRDLWVAICDVIFWVICSVIVYLAVYISNSAELRWHELIGLVIGFVLYSIYLSRYCMGILCSLVKLVHKGCGYISKIICMPRRIMHILILPLHKPALSAKTRILYVARESFDKIHPKRTLDSIKTTVSAGFTSIIKKFHKKK